MRLAYYSRLGPAHSDHLPIITSLLLNPIYHS